MTKWEYRVVDSREVSYFGKLGRITRADVEAYLCIIGKEGWEIVNLKFHHVRGTYEFNGVAKREVVE